MPQGDVEVNVIFGCATVILCLSHTFKDVDPDAWYHDPVDWAIESGYLKGYKDTGRLGPLDTTNRAQFVTMLARIAGTDRATRASRAEPDLATSPRTPGMRVW